MPMTSTVARTMIDNGPCPLTWFLRKVAAVVVGESFDRQTPIASVEFALLPARDRLRCLATGVGVGRIFRSSMSFSSVENGDVKTSRWATHANAIPLANDFDCCLSFRCRVLVRNDLDSTTGYGAHFGWADVRTFWAGCPSSMRDD